MILGIDIGNTTVEFGFIKNAENIKSYKLKSDHFKTADDWLLDIQQILLMEKNPEISDFVISSVVPIIEKKLIESLERLSGKKPLIIGKDLKIPMKINYKNPQEIGTDRLVNAFATIKKYGFPAVVVDFGTAVTFDVISKEGSYEGGAIFPGIDASLNALFTKTAKLPSVSFEKPPSIIGKTTVESIQSGVFFGYISLVEGLIKKINDFYGCSHILVITGGGGKLIQEGIATQNIYDRYLSMEGIYQIYIENKD